jgi:hypothetical protein
VFLRQEQLPNLLLLVAQLRLLLVPQTPMLPQVAQNPNTSNFFDVQ